MTVPIGAMAATNAAAAAAAVARGRKEEEEMTPYKQEDLAEGWEFKILRSATGMFKHPEKMQAALEQEARAGWMLVEKFDDSRIRLKRSERAKEGDANLEFDPYRTSVGIGEGRLGLYIVLGILGTIGFVAAAIFLLAR